MRSFFILTFLAMVPLACSGDEPTCQQEGNCPLESECAANAECASELCLKGVDFSRPETSLCAAGCDSSDECPGVCALFEIDSEDAAPENAFVGACTERELGFRDLGDSCSSDVQCSDALCHDGRCTALCGEPEDCPTDARCVDAELRPGFRSGACRWAPLEPSITLGPFEVSPDGSQPIEVEVPETGAFAAVIRSNDSTDFGRRIGFVEVLATDGTLLYERDAEDPINPASVPYPQTAVFMVPNTDDGRANVHAGVYTFRLGVWDVDPTAENPFTPTSGTIEALEIQLVDEEARGGVIDLVLHESPGSGVDLEGSEFVEALVTEIETRFAEAPLVVGSIELATIGEEFDTLTSSDEVRELCASRASPGIDGRAVNLFFIDDLAFASGFTGTSPSPAGFYGFGASGVVVEHDGNVSNTAKVAAHELGHFLGLLHTTSFVDDGNGLSRSGFDPLSDTPECDVGQLSECADRENLMFPFIEFSGALSLSNAQAAVVSRSPALYGLRHDDLCPASVLDITRPRAASGFLDASTGSGTCGGEGPEAAHVLRVFETTNVVLESSGHTGPLRVVSQSCAGDELLCEEPAEDGIAVTLDPGVYFVFVEGEAGEGYRLWVRSES